jgi:hypothetical protein
MITHARRARGWKHGLFSSKINPQQTKPVGWPSSVDLVTFSSMKKADLLLVIECHIEPLGGNVSWIPAGLTPQGFNSVYARMRPQTRPERTQLVWSCAYCRKKYTTKQRRTECERVHGQCPDTHKHASTHHREKNDYNSTMLQHWPQPGCEATAPPHRVRSGPFS